jgi:L-lactate dehydrogenase complex protein LldE
MRDGRVSPHYYISMTRPHLFVPCIVDQLFPQTGLAAIAVLRSLGVDPIYNPEQTCCGQTAFNAGYHEDARIVAERFINTFESAGEIISLSGSCAAMIKVLYPQIDFPVSLRSKVELLSRRTYEFTNYIVQRLGRTDIGARFSGRVAYHDSCHILRELRISEEPRLLLKAVRGLELVELDLADRCCGFGGMFAVKFPGISLAMGEDKLASIKRAGVDIVVGCDNSCLMHLQGLAEVKGENLRTMHIAEFLQKSIQNDPLKSGREHAA